MLVVVVLVVVVVGGGGCSVFGGFGDGGNCGCGSCVMGVAYWWWRWW